MLKKMRELVSVCRGLEGFKNGEFFYRSEGGEQANALVAGGYIRPHKTEVMTLQGPCELDHYVWTEKGIRLYEKTRFLRFFI